MTTNTRNPPIYAKDKKQFGINRYIRSFPLYPLFHFYEV